MADPLAIPSGWIRRFAHLVPPGGTVLDVAAGGGRHSRFFMERHHPVVALDRNLTGMADLSGRDGIDLIEADLEAGWPLGEQRFGAVIITNFLHRPLFPALVDALETGGVLLYETFARGNEAFGRPAGPDHLLRAGELLERCASLQVVAYEHGLVYTPRTAALSRIAAVRAEDPRAL